MGVLWEQRRARTGPNSFLKLQGVEDRQKGMGNKQTVLCAYSKIQIMLMPWNDRNMQVFKTAVHRGKEGPKMEVSNEWSCRFFYGK